MDEEVWQKLIQVVLLNKGKIIGGIIGFIFGILFLSIGFFKTLLILVCIITGYYLGSRWEILMVISRKC